MADRERSMEPAKKGRPLLYALIGGVIGIVAMNVIGFDHPAGQGLAIAAGFAVMITAPAVVAVRRNRRKSRGG